MAREGFAVEAASEMLLSLTKPVRDVETVLLHDVLGRVAAETTPARHDQPPFDRSPLDGFAFSHLDAAEAGPDNPARLRIVADIFAGDAGVDRLERGQAVRILTGAPIPPGATCVVRQEDVTVENGTVAVPVRLGEYDNYCFRGEYLAKGAVLVDRGSRVDRGRLALLAGDGMDRLPVFRRPRVAVLSTGNELRSGPGPLAPGEIFDGNAPLLAARVGELGASVTVCRAVPDDAGRIATAMNELLAACDLLVTTGGVSVGDRDCLPEAGRLAGMRQVFHGVQVKPGSPALALEKEGKLAVCLSGNPFAAFVTFELLAAPVVRRLCGLSDATSSRVACRLGEVFPKAGGTRRFAPARLEGGKVFFSGKAGSRSLATLVDCNCLVDIPAGKTGLPAGSPVEAVLL